MGDYKPSDFLTIKKEVTDVLSVLRQYRLNFELSDKLKRRFHNETLFDGDDDLIWTDPKNKSKGYEIKNGSKTTRTVVEKKK